MNDISTQKMIVYTMKMEGICRKIDVYSLKEEYVKSVPEASIHGLLRVSNIVQDVVTYNVSRLRELLVGWVTVP